MGLTGLTSMAGLHSFLESLGQNLFSCLFQLIEAVHIPWLLVTLL